MPKQRRKLSAPYRDFTVEIGRLRKFDAENQRIFTSAPSGWITKKQLHFIVESVFFAGFKAFEGFIRDVFLLYCLEKQPSARKKVRSYLDPKSFEHAEQLIQSNMPFLDWSSPHNVIGRAELYLENGYPVKEPYASRLEKLADYKKIRNQIAHSSKESEANYAKVLRKYYGTIPLTVPAPGEFMLEQDKANPANYLLLTYFDTLEELAQDLI